MKASTQAIFSLIKHNKRIYIVDSLIMFVANATEALIPLFFGSAIGSAVAGGDLSRTFFYLFGAWLLNVVHMCFWHAGDYWIIKRVYADTYTFRDISYRYIWKYDYARFIDLPSSKIAASANRLQENLRRLYDSFHYGFYSIAIYYLTLTISASTIAWQNGLIYLAFILLAVGVLARRVRSITRSSARLADQLAEVDGKVFDSVANFTNVFSFNSKRKEISKNQKLVQDLFNVQYDSERAGVDFWATASGMMRVLLWAVILGLNFHLLRRGAIDQTGFAAAIAVLVSFTGAYWNMVSHIKEFGSRAASYDQNYTYLFDRNIIAQHFEETQNPVGSNPTLKDSLKFDGVSFAYPDSPDASVLTKVDLEVKHREKIGIVGRSGGGKSTLVKLLLGFYEPTDGQILVDDLKLSRDDRSRLVSYVPQDTTLFQETIAYNIGYAVSGRIKLSEVVAAAKKAHAHEFISRLPNGYDTLVGERGVKLSLGQRQRIALARAFLKDTELLVLDEATSSLDSKTEKDIQDSLELLWRDKTVIAIAHRLSTLNNVDRIIVVDGGKIAEVGTKAELLKQNGKFKELWDHQKNGLI